MHPLTKPVDTMANYIKKDSFLERKIPVYWLLIALLIPTIGCIVLATRKTTIVASEAQPCDVYSSLTNARIQTYEFARPLLYYDVINEDSRLADVKSKIEAFIEQKKREGALSTASVYLRKGGGWIAINQDEQYSPASLEKVPILITYLKDVERDPALLNKQIFFEHHFGELPKQNIKVFSLVEKKYYSIKELLHAMIAYSDNDALNLLFQNMNNATFKQLYVDLKLEIPDLSIDVYKISVVNYSKFFRILINATYLSNDLSEMALKMLTECTYKDGITKDFDDKVKVAHKFGERAWPDRKELHEFGIIYRGRKAYIIGIMTRGKDFKQLSEVLSGISDIVYKDSTPETSSGYQTGPPMAAAK